MPRRRAASVAAILMALGVGAAAVDGRVFMRSRHGVLCYDFRTTLPEE